MTRAKLDFEIKNIGTEKDIEVNLDFWAGIPEGASSEMEEYIYYKTLFSVKGYLDQFIEEEFPEERQSKISNFILSQISKPD